LYWKNNSRSFYDLLLRVAEAFCQRVKLRRGYGNATFTRFGVRRIFFKLPLSLLWPEISPFTSLFLDNLFNELNSSLVHHVALYRKLNVI
jgi:hypothetical protein